MADLIVECPKCQKGYKISDSYAGKVTKCRKCETKFIIPNFYRDSQRVLKFASIISENAGIPVANLIIKCPNCNLYFKINESYAGKTIFCSKCKMNLLSQINESGSPIATIVKSSAEAAAGVEQTIAASATAKKSSLQDIESEVSAEWNVGEVILGLYEVKEIHKGGGMGLVYRVHHRGWNMDLAVKSPRAEYFQTEEQRGNFVRECEAWINLGLHPHIVSCYYVRVLGGIPRVFAEYVEGGSLKDWIEAGILYEGGFERSLERILDIAIQFAWALQYAHEQGLIHQDVKPANVMMTPDGIAKVTDFGLAKARALTGESQIITGRTILVSSGGMTPAYCSPEQAEGKQLSRKTDIWSWGVSVLEMFTGEVTWLSGQAAGESLESYLEIGIDDEVIPKMPDELADVLRRCFQKNPLERPKDMVEVVSAFREIYQQTIRKSYPREMPKPTEALADSLNNRAISLIDLGKRDEALHIFDEALKVDPMHPQVTYNQGLVLWRVGKITDDELVRRLEAVKMSRTSEDWLPAYLLGLVHIERSDAESAVKELEQAFKLSGYTEEINAELENAKNGVSRWSRCLRTLEGHTDPVYSVAISPDGRFALSGSADKTLRLWDLAKGKRLRTLKSHTKGVISMALSSDGQFALSGSWEKTLLLWDLATGKFLRTLEGHTSWVDSVAISPDGRFGLSGSQDKTLRLWDLATGQCLRTLEGHTDPVYSVAISPDGRFALSGSWDRTLRLWELATGQCLRTLEGHTNWVHSVAISADGRFALSGSSDKTIRLWELATGKCLRTLEGHTSSVSSVVISSDERFALSGSGDKTLRLWELATGKCLRTLEGHTDEVISVAISPDGLFALSGSGDKTLRLWTISLSGEIAPFIVAQPQSALEIFKTTSDFKALLAEAEDSLKSSDIRAAAQSLTYARKLPGYKLSTEALELWRMVGKYGIRKRFSSAWLSKILRDHISTVTSVVFSLDGRFALSGSADKTLRLWDLATGQCLRILEGHTELVHSVAISADGRFALSGSNDQYLRLWDLATGQCLRILQGHTQWVDSVAISPDGRFGLSGNSDNTLRLWDLATGQCLRTFGGHTDSVYSVAISPDGRFALSGSWDKTLRLWDLATGRCLRTLKGHTDWVNSVAISPDGRFALSGSEDKTLRLWDFAKGKHLRTLKGHTDWVNSVAISPDGRFALSGSRDKTLRLWDLATGQCLRTLQGHTGWVFSVAISPDGWFALSGSADNTVRLWGFDWEYEFPEPADWDKRARPYLEVFLTLHCPYGKDGISRVGKSSWNNDDFRKLLEDLIYRGYGWLRPEGVRRELEKMTRKWQGPPSL